jgi:hypothetical protein
MSFMHDYSGDTEPTIDGIYACRVDHPDMPGFHTDRFLQLHKGRWGYPGSDQRFRGEIHGWVGPIPRTRTAKAGVTK